MAAKPKKTEEIKITEEVIQKPKTIAPNGAFFGVMTLPMDAVGTPKTHRIVQMVIDGGQYRTYISENAYMRSELKDKFYAVERAAFEFFARFNAPILNPIKTRIHWCEFTEEFLKTGKGPRVNPENGEAEKEEA